MFFLFTLPKERSTSDFGTFLCKIQPAPPINVITWSGFPKFIELHSLVNDTKCYTPYKYENAKTSSKEFIFLRNILDSLTEVYIRSRAVGLVPCTSYSLRTPWRLPRWCRTMRGWQEVHGRWLQWCWSNWRWRASNQRPWHQMFFLKNVIVGGNSWCRGVGHKGVMTNQLFFFVLLHVDSKKRDGIWWKSTVLLVKRVGRHKRFADLLSGNFENPVLTHFGKSSSKSFWCHCSTNLFSVDHREPSSSQSHSSKNTLKPTNEWCHFGHFGKKSNIPTIPTVSAWVVRKSKDIISYNSNLSAVAGRNSNWCRALQFFKELCRNRLSPTVVTSSAMISGCNLATRKTRTKSNKKRENLMHKYKKRWFGNLYITPVKSIHSFNLFA